MPLVIVAIGIVALLILIMGLKLNTFVSLIVVSFGVAIALGMKLDEIIATIEAGLGGTLGHIALIFGLGAMLGKLIADSGGAQRIAMTLVNKFGEKNIQWAVVAASFIIGIALFFEVGLVLLIPIVFAISKQLKVSILYLGIPMAAALSVTHGFLPPHPGPTTIAVNTLIPNPGVSSILNVFCSPNEAILPVLKNDCGTNFLANFVNKGPAIKTVGMEIIKP